MLWCSNNMSAPKGTFTLPNSKYLNTVDCMWQPTGFVSYEWPNQCKSFTVYPRRSTAWWRSWTSSSEAQICMYTCITLSIRMLWGCTPMCLAVERRANPAFLLMCKLERPYWKQYCAVALVVKIFPAFLWPCVDALVCVAQEIFAEELAIQSLMQFRIICSHF